MKKASEGEGRPAEELISERMEELGDRRGKTLGRMRKLIREADPDEIGSRGALAAGQQDYSATLRTGLF